MIPGAFSSTLWRFEDLRGPWPSIGLLNGLVEFFDLNFFCFGIGD